MRFFDIASNDISEIENHRNLPILQYQITTIKQTRRQTEQLFQRKFSHPSSTYHHMAHANGNKNNLKQNSPPKNKQKNKLFPTFKMSVEA